MAAVQEDGLALRYVVDKTYAVCLAALNQSPACAKFISD